MHPVLPASEPQSGMVAICNGHLHQHRRTVNSHLFPGGFGRARSEPVQIPSSRRSNFDPRPRRFSFSGRNCDSPLPADPALFDEFYGAKVTQTSFEIITADTSSKLEAKAQYGESQLIEAA
eukprot:3917708-Rhodomonas_salina.6